MAKRTKTQQQAHDLIEGAYRLQRAKESTAHDLAEYKDNQLTKAAMLMVSPSTLTQDRKVMQASAQLFGIEHLYTPSANRLEELAIVGAYIVREMERIIATREKNKEDLNLN